MKYLTSIPIFQKAARANGKSQLEVCGAANITEWAISEVTLAVTFHPVNHRNKFASNFFKPLFWLKVNNVFIGIEFDKLRTLFTKLESRGEKLL